MWVWGGGEMAGPGSVAFISVSRSVFIQEHVSVVCMCLGGGVAAQVFSVFSLGLKCVVLSFISSILFRSGWIS